MLASTHEHDEEVARINGVRQIKNVFSINKDQKYTFVYINKDQK